MKPLVLIADETHPLLAEGLEQLGFEVQIRPGIAPESVAANIRNLTGIIVNSRIRFDQQLLDEATQLRFIGRLGSGREIIQVEYAESKGIAVHFSPEGNAPAVAEHALGLLLSTMRFIRRADDELRRGIWKREENRGHELGEKTVAIYGYGHTGKAFARVISGLGCRVLAHDKYLGEGDAYATLTDRETLFREADVVSLHLPLTPETRHYANADFFAAFEKKVVLLNTSRGEVCDTHSLLQAIDNQKIIAAALDVFESEPPWKDPAFAEKWNRLLASEQLVVTPHIAGWTMESKARMARILLERIKNQFSEQNA